MRRNTVSGFMATITFLLVCTSCGAGGVNLNASNGKPISSSLPPANNSASQLRSPGIEEPKTKSIRDVDFKNCKYPWYPSYLKPPDGSREIVLENGNFEIREDERTGIKNLILELSNVSYAHLQPDKEIAIVTISGISVFNQFVGCLFVFGGGIDDLTLLLQHEFGDRADGGLRRVAIEGQTLIVEQYERAEGDGGLCCPTRFVRSYFNLVGSRFKQARSESLVNEFPNARFLGYPSDSP